MMPGIGVYEKPCGLIGFIRLSMPCTVSIIVNFITKFRNVVLYNAQKISNPQQNIFKPFWQGSLSLNALFFQALFQQYLRKIYITAKISDTWRAIYGVVYVCIV